MQILVVADDETSLEMLRNALETAGHRVQVARSGEQALGMLHKGSCRMVITDWNMPGLSGEELCRQIRGGDLGGYIYVILLTSMAGAEYGIRGLSAGADEFISKPFGPAELAARVRTGERVLSLETRDVAIFSLAKLAESRDPETGAHLERMRVYSRILAQHLCRVEPTCHEIDGEYVRLMYLTSPLHDIGKVGVPDSVLLKPARLSAQEFETMKTHTTMGADTLKAAIERFPGAQFLHMARDIALSHHERYDGSGYPRGLAGEQIPLCGRIVALADVYDALTSRRVYKQAFSHDVAREMILEESGAQFDPLVVQAFLANEDEFQSVWEQFSQHMVAVA